jgi:hypothetical protein
MHLFHFLGCHGIFPQAEERMWYHAPFPLPGRPRHILASIRNDVIYCTFCTSWEVTASSRKQQNRKDVISCTFSTFWEVTASSCKQKNRKDVISCTFSSSREATASSRKQKRGCDVWHLLHFLGGHGIFPQAEERMWYHAPSLLPGRPRQLSASNRKDVYIMHPLYFLGGHVIFLQAEERMWYHAPSLLPGRPRQLSASNRKDVISCTFSTSWVATASSHKQKKGCDIMHLLYFLGCHGIFPQAEERMWCFAPSLLHGMPRDHHACKRNDVYIMHLIHFLGGHGIFPQATERMWYHAPSVLPGLPRHLPASNKKDVISWTFRTFWDATESSRKQKKGCDIMHLLYFMGGRVIIMHAKEMMWCLAPSLLPGRPRQLHARKRKDVISCTLSTSWVATASSRKQKKGCDIMHLLYLLGGHGNFTQAEVMPCTFSTSWEATSTFRKQKKGCDVMHSLYFMGGHGIFPQAEE